jgi:hypothetical protein
MKIENFKKENIADLTTTVNPSTIKKLLKDVKFLHAGPFF